MPVVSSRLTPNNPATLVPVVVSVSDEALLSCKVIGVVVVALPIVVVAVPVVLMLVVPVRPVVPAKTRTSPTGNPPWSFVPRSSTAPAASARV